MVHSSSFHKFDILSQYRRTCTSNRSSGRKVNASLHTWSYAYSNFGKYRSYGFFT